MSTFFEKLTGSRAPDPQDQTFDHGSEREEVQRPPRARAPQRPQEESHPMRVRIEHDEPREPAYESEPEPAEEEGELTVDIYDKGDSIVIQSTVAGVKPEDIDVTITNDSVTIRGKRERSEETREDSYYYKELFWGTFSRSVILPEEIDEDLAEATLKHGLLSVRLPKKRRGVVQKLKVKVT